MADSGQVRADIMSHAAKAALMINGGGAIAVLGFLQAIWGKAPGLTMWAISSVAVFAVGTVVAATINAWRCKVSELWQYQDGTAYLALEQQSAECKKYKRREKWALVGSWVLFLSAIAVLLVGAWANI